MSSTCPTYPRFSISNTILGSYSFDVNPSIYDVYPARTTRPYSTVQSSDPTVDQTYNKIEVEYRWDFMPESMWNDLYPYTRKNDDGTTDSTLVFSDGNIGRFSSTPITVVRFEAEVQGGFFPVDRQGVTLRIRQLS